MSSRSPDPRARAASATASALAVLLLLAGCQREERRFREVPPGATAAPAVVLNDEVQPGPTLVDPEVRNAYEENAWAVTEGEQLYNAFNCAGCHAPGGGGAMGPPFRDSVWIYGHEPENVFQSIVQGRPAGMPAFRGRIGNSEVWKLVAYVRSLASLTPKSTRTGRTEHINEATNDPQREPMIPLDQRIPPEQRPPAPPRRP